MAIVRKSLIGLVAVCVAQGVALAQSPVRDAYVQIANGKPEEAKKILEAYLATNPSNADAFTLWEQTDKDIFRDILVRKDELGKMAAHLLSLAQKERVAKSRDEAAINALVGKIGDDAFDVRASAMTELANKHGEFAVPALAAILGNADEADGQIYAIQCLTKIGRDATVALVECLGSSNATLRRNAAATLSLIKDHRSVAGLAALLRDENAGVRSVAEEALKGMGVGANASALDLYLSTAKDYLLGRNTMGDVPGVVWSLKDGKLVHTDCKVDVYPFELAKRNAEAAMAIDPSNAEAASLIARSYLAQIAAIENNKLEDLAEVKTGLNMVAMAMGPAVLGKALTDSIGDSQLFVAVQAIRALGNTTDEKQLGSSPLLAMLDHDSKMVRYAAALAVSKASRASTVPQSDKVVAILGDAVGEQALKRVATVGLDNAGKAQAENANSKNKGIWVDAGMGTAQRAVSSLIRGIVRADVVVVNETLSDAIPETLIGLLAKNPATQNVKVLIVAKDADKAAERFGDKVAGVIEAGFKAEDLQNKVEEALKDVDMGENNARAAAVAVEAANALEGLAERNVAISGAVANLAAELGRADEVAIPAAKALGEGGDSIQPLLSTIQSGDSSVELKIACAAAAGKILGRIGTLNDGEFDALLGVATKADNDAKLRTAAVTALGKAKLIPGQQLKMVKALSTAAVAGN